MIESAYLVSPRSTDHDASRPSLIVVIVVFGPGVALTGVHFGLERFPWIDRT